jgi:hypothetical protein
MQETVRRLWNAAAWTFFVIGALSGIVFLRLAWVPRMDFDILGFAWLLLNSGKIGAFVVMVLCFSFSAYLWLRVRLGR